MFTYKNPDRACRATLIRRPSCGSSQTQQKKRRRTRRRRTTKKKKGKSSLKKSTRQKKAQGRAKASKSTGNSSGSSDSSSSSSSDSTSSSTSGSSSKTGGSNLGDGLAASSEGPQEARDALPVSRQQATRDYRRQYLGTWSRPLQKGLTRPDQLSKAAFGAILVLACAAIFSRADNSLLKASVWTEKHEDGDEHYHFPLLADRRSPYSEQDVFQHGHALRTQSTHKVWSATRGGDPPGSPI